MTRLRLPGRKWLTPLLLLVGLLGAQVGVLADEQYPVVPDPAECTVAPRSFDDITTLFASATPVAEPVTPAMVEIPTGSPADLAAVAGVTATIHEAFACLNGNDILRFFSLLTDQAIITNFSWVGEMIASGEFPAEMLTPEAQPAEYQQTVIAIASINRLTLDGRVGAMVTSIDPSSESLEPQAMFLILTLIGDRWLIDEVVEFSS